MKNNLQTVITITSNETCILISDKSNPKIKNLFYNSFNNQKMIKNCLICEIDEYKKLIHNLIQTASKFMNFPINEIYLAIDYSNIKIKPFESNGLKNDNNLLNARVFEQEIKPNLMIQKNIDDFTFDIEINEWIINNEKLTKLVDNYNVSQYDIKGFMYQINKIQYEHFIRLFNNIGIKIIKVLPIISSSSKLIPTTIKNFIVIYLNDEHLNINFWENNKLINCIESNLSLKTLKQMLNKKFELSEFEVEEILKLYWIKNNDNDLCLKNTFFEKFKKVSSIHHSDIKNLITEFISRINKYIEEQIVYFKMENNFNFNNIYFLTNNKFIEYLYNLIRIKKNCEVQLLKINNELPINYLFAFLITQEIYNEKNKYSETQIKDFSLKNLNNLQDDAE